MVDYGPVSVTKSIAPSEFSYNTPLFLSQMKDEAFEKPTSIEGQGKQPETRESSEKNLEPVVFKNSAASEKNLDESKDSDEGFSSSFSPTSEPQMLQQETSAVSSAFWGRDEFLHHELPMMGGSTPLMYSSTPGSSPLPSSNAQSRRGNGALPSYPTGHNSRRPFPAVSTLLASNKAVANALGVSNWNANSNSPSSWPSQSQSVPVSSNWPQQQQNRAPQQPFPLSIQPTINPIAPLQQQSGNRSNKMSQFSIANFPKPPYRNGGRPIQSFNTNAATLVSSSKSSPFGLQNSVTNHSSLDMTVVDDITQLTNTFSNLTTSSETSSSGLFASQERNDIMKYSSLEPRLLDMLRSPIDNQNDNLQSFRSQLQRKGYSHQRDADQIVPSLNSSLNGSPRSELDLMERYSRKVFVGGLPPDIDEDEIHASFCRFGHLSVDWPHKAESKSYFPPKGYAFLLYKEEISVQRLMDACMIQDGKFYLCVSSPTIKDKPVQIRPWNLADADFVMDSSQPLDPRKTIFVGGVPRPLRAVELAMIMDRLYGGVCYAGIDVDPELKYPKGAGRVAFSNQQSYIAAISARFIQLQHGDIDKRVEVKPYVLDDQMCDECHGVRCNGKFAPFFCSNITCLLYYCEQCWAIVHSRPGREFHKPLVKEGGDRPRHSPMNYRW
eukprot:gene5619-6310_t